MRSRWPGAAIICPTTPATVPCSFPSRISASSLPKDEYYRLTRTQDTKHLHFDLLRQFDNIPDDADGDIFGQINEYFLGKFALSEGQGGGEFFTPRSVVRLMVEIIEPHGGTVFNPACGSGGMFVQSAGFIAAHRSELQGQGKDTSVFVYGQEKRSETVKLARMNLAVKAEVSRVLDDFLPHGNYDTIVFNEKRDKVFELTLDLAINRLRWAA